MSSLFGIDISDMFFWIFKVPTGLLVGLGAAFLFFRQSLEGRLRQRRSPGNVRMESIAWALAIGGLIPTLSGGFGIGIFALFFISALIVAIVGRSGVATWVMLGLTLVLGAIAFPTHLTYEGPPELRRQRERSSQRPRPPTITNTATSPSPFADPTNASGAGSTNSSGTLP
jgi:hypothetical protein